MLWRRMQMKLATFNSATISRLKSSDTGKPFVYCRPKTFTAALFKVLVFTTKCISGCATLFLSSSLNYNRKRQNPDMRNWVRAVWMKSTCHWTGSNSVRRVLYDHCGGQRRMEYFFVWFCLLTFTLAQSLRQIDVDWRPFSGCYYYQRSW